MAAGQEVVDKMFEKLEVAFKKKRKKNLWNKWIVMTEAK